ncbi:SprT-like domain-containing protein [Streptomyces erythrochromogenes]|nr:SprT-like domain-containing protein [Streptomyces erythrochromogenes]
MIELELWHPDWGYWDDFGDFVGPADDDASTTVALAITGDVLRRIPLGQIVAQAQAELASQSWKGEGVTTIGLGSAEGRQPGELAPASVRALENAGDLAQPVKRGRPPLEGTLLHELAHAYLREAGNGPGLHRRLADLFERPEPTIKDWIKAARERGYLSPAVPSNRAEGGQPPPSA